MELPFSKSVIEDGFARAAGASNPRNRISAALDIAGLCLAQTLGRNPTKISEAEFAAWLKNNAADLKGWMDKKASSPEKAVDLPERIAAKAKTTRIDQVLARLAQNGALANLPDQFRAALLNTMTVFSQNILASSITPMTEASNPSVEECKWAGQPWLPLFIEWEAEYPPASVENYRALQGKLEEFLKTISISFARLDGFTDHLLTFCQETVLTSPNDLHMLQDGKGESDPIESFGGLDITPYSNTHDELTFSASRRTQGPAKKDRFFCPVTHGQASITQLKLVDRFGQVICAVNPANPQPLCPNSEDEVFSDDCQWFQIPPRINQDARINAAFMRVYTKGSSDSCLVGAGENAIFAWLLVNFHNRSLRSTTKPASSGARPCRPTRRATPWTGTRARGEAKAPNMLRVPEHEVESLRDKFKTTMSSAHVERMLSHMATLAPLTLRPAAISARRPPCRPRPPRLGPQAGHGAHAKPSLRRHVRDLPGRIATTDPDPHTNPSETTGSEPLTRYTFGLKLGDATGPSDGLIASLNSHSPTPADDDGAVRINTDYSGRDGPPRPFISHAADSPPLTVRPAYPRLLTWQSTSGDDKETNVAEEIASWTAASSSATSAGSRCGSAPARCLSARTGKVPWQRRQERRERDIRRRHATTSRQGCRSWCPSGGEEKWKWFQPVGVVAGDNGGMVLPAEFEELEVRPPLRTGFDTAVSAKGRPADGVETGMVTLLEGYLVAGA
ncbi:hypothetical protein B0H66DRAFT_620830 [Apodospora peruviana]|uniref:Uncharacterized protein n=1 Tax=Apodospora peruviana TaxID=516989 RepID=A0AAE0ID70_9PEZI|nr:hypothetical protein B0H66DRAFT_620830 [Apodospora peruviana]